MFWRTWTKKPYRKKLALDLGQFSPSAHLKISHIIQLFERFRENILFCGTFGCKWAHQIIKTLKNEILIHIDLPYCTLYSIQYILVHSQLTCFTTTHSAHLFYHYTFSSLLLPLHSQLTCFSTTLSAHMF